MVMTPSRPPALSAGGPCLAMMTEDPPPHIVENPKLHQDFLRDRAFRVQLSCRGVGGELHNSRSRKAAALDGERG